MSNNYGLNAFGVSNLEAIMLLLQWLLRVLSRHSTLFQRMEGQLKCVLLCTSQTLTVPSSSLSLSCSLLETSLQVYNHTSIKKSFLLNEGGYRDGKL